MQGPELGRAIKARLARLGWSQHGFVRLVNNTGLTTLSSGYLSQLINGQVQRVGSDKLQAFAQVFGVSVDQLLDLEVDGRPAQPLHPGIVDLPAPLAHTIKRIGRYLTPRDWERAAAFLEGMAAARGAEGPTAQGSQASDISEPSEERKE